jgi:hypothetical protein
MAAKLPDFRLRKRTITALDMAAQLPDLRLRKRTITALDMAAKLPDFRLRKRTITALEMAAQLVNFRLPSQAVVKTLSRFKSGSYCFISSRNRVVNRPGMALGLFNLAGQDRDGH